MTKRVEEGDNTTRSMYSKYLFSDTGLRDLTSRSTVYLL